MCVYFRNDGRFQRITTLDTCPKLLAILKVVSSLTDNVEKGNNAQTAQRIPCVPLPRRRRWLRALRR